MKVNILTIAERLHKEVEMSEGEFRSLLKALFPDVPGSHVNSIVRTVKRAGKKQRFNVLVERVGGALFE